MLPTTVILPPISAGREALTVHSPIPTLRQERQGWGTPYVVVSAEIKKLEPPIQI